MLPLTRLTRTATRAVIAVYVLFLLIAAWPENLRTDRISQLSLRVGFLMLGRIGIEPGRPVFWAPAELQRWWPIQRCLDVTGFMDDGATRVARLACPRSGARITWNPVDSMLYLWLIESRSSSPGLRELRLGAGVDWFCRTAFGGAGPVSRVRIESVQEDIDYETGARREQRRLEFEKNCARTAAR